MSDTTNLVLFAILANFAYMAALALIAIGLLTAFRPASAAVGSTG